MGGRAPAEPAVHDVQRAPRVTGRQVRVVGDQHHALPGGVQVQQQRADLLAGGGVQRPGRLVGQQQFGPVDQCPGDRHPLPLPAGEPARVGVAVPLDVQRGQQFAGPCPGLAAAHSGELRGQQHVVGDGQVVEQIEELKDHSNTAPPESGYSRFAEPVHPVPGYGHRAAGRLVQAGDEVQQGGLAAARRSHHRHSLTRCYFQAHAVHGGLAVVVIAFGHVVDPHESIHERHGRQGDAATASAAGCKCAARQAPAGLPGHPDGGPGYITRRTPCCRHGGDTGLVRERFAVPVRAWFSQAWAFARSAEPRTPLSRRAILTDIAAVALVASLLAVGATYVGQPAQFAVDPRTSAVVVVGVTQVQQVWGHALLAILFTSLPLAARRRFPLGAFVVLLAGTLATQNYATLVTFLAIVFAGYSAVAYSRFRGAAVLSMIPASLIVATHYWNASPSNLQVSAGPVQPGGLASLKYAGVAFQTGAQWRVPGLVAAFSLILIAVIGNAMQAQDRIRRMQAEHAAATRRALDEERALIASELHDVVTHNVSVMIVQAGAARQVLAADPAEATAALLAVESSGRAAMTELRHLLGLLSPAGTGEAPGPGTGAADGAGAGQDLSPQPGLARLQPLIDRVGAAGLPASLQVSGVPQVLPPGLDLAAYRVVQEALTNVIKHSGKSRTIVRLDYRAADLVVEVADTGRPIPAAGPAPSAVPGSGRGLLGLRERMALYGGELDAGPAPSGGWLARARLPVDPPAGTGAGARPAGLTSRAAGNQ